MATSEVFQGKAGSEEGKAAFVSKKEGFPWKASLERFRERQGGLSEEKRRYQRRLTEERRAVRAALATPVTVPEIGGHTALAAPATVPEIAKRAGLPAATALWHVTAMRKYGQVREVDLDGDYPRYALVEEPEKT